MKKVILLALLMPCLAFGQIEHNFESGDLSTWVQSPDGHWNTDASYAISGSLSLHHSFDNIESGTDRIGLPISDLHPSEGLTKWSFLIRHGYDPSSSNNWSVFLMSDSEPSLISPSSGTNGFVIGVNLSGYDDTLRLWKVKDGVLSAIVNTGLNWQTTIGTTASAKIDIERSVEGKFTVSVYSPDGSLISEGYGVDSELFNSAWFGIYYRYTSTRDRLLWFDDLNINGIFYEDKAAPEVVSCKASGKKLLNIIFNEKPDDQSLIPENFSLNENDNRIISVIKMSDLTYALYLESDLVNKFTNILVLHVLCDKSGNCMQNISVEITLIWAELGDVIISEIMADPLPEVSLPGKEYLEIFNRTEFPYNLKNWMLRSEDQDWILPETIIEPMEYAIVCSSKDTLGFREYGKVIGLKQFPTLTDGGKLICISDSSGIMLHGVEYSSEWHSGKLKSSGGWSLELIDHQYPFSGSTNWTSSISGRGGSPGEANSVSRGNQDITFYGIENVFPVNNMSINLRFSEPLFLLPENMQYLCIEGVDIIGIVTTDLLFREFTLRIREPIRTRETYEFKILNPLGDFAGNIMERSSFSFGLTEAAERSDILFNELLFNPMAGDPDYIELFNNSMKILDASRLQLLSVNDESGDTSSFSSLSDSRRCIMPGQYYAVCTDREKIINRYNFSDPEHLFEVSSLPSMADEKGHIILYNRELELIDEVRYREDMHLSLLSGYEGIALEKTGPGNSSGISANWHSAAASSGWGTPGAPNSIYADVEEPVYEVSLSSSRITPDSDGIDDFLTISISLKGIGNVVSIDVFTESGSYIRNIATNLFIGPGSSLIWDGTADDGSPVRNGIYILLISSFDDAGKTGRWKKVCTVIRN